MRVVQGDIWLTESRPTTGHEQSGRRPALVISNQEYIHASGGKLVIIAPLTTRFRDWSTHVRIDPVEGTGLREISYAMSEQIRTVSRQRLRGWVGSAPKAALNEVTEWVRDML
ncbi:type II toxin-antitoxin system PemK/MazF family toxin [Sphaerimonospora sp. CA-214678]|uniref:type II toxin-antitoxin system PemK/MazF family toxin n=1 Tax=Sphaerimonospora sp. CA-214678 TaxID=3240029 RepID=UPI003D91C935